MSKVDRNIRHKRHRKQEHKANNNLNKGTQRKTRLIHLTQCSVNVKLAGKVIIFPVFEQVYLVSLFTKFRAQKGKPLFCVYRK